MYRWLESGKIVSNDNVIVNENNYHLYKKIKRHIKKSVKIGDNQEGKLSENYLKLLNYNDYLFQIRLYFCSNSSSLSTRLGSGIIQSIGHTLSQVGSS